MQKYMIAKSMRFFFFFTGTIMWVGIWLTGFSVTHWLLYIPAIFVYFAAITGICPGLIFSRLIFGDKERS